MSKINKKKLKLTIKNIFNPEKTRNFIESIDIQVVLCGYDPRKHKRVRGRIVLPHEKWNRKICVFPNALDEDRARENGIHFIKYDQLRPLKRDKRKLKKLLDSYYAFLASKSIIRRIPRLLGPLPSRKGKFPSVLMESDDIKEKVGELKRTIIIRYKNRSITTIAASIGALNMSEEEIFENFQEAIKGIVVLLPKKWNCVKKIVLKSTMGKPYEVF